MVVDFDDYQALTEIFGDEPPETLTCATARGAHLYFRAHKDFRTSSSKFKANVDVRAPGSWIMLPPSIHKTQVRYEWDCLARPANVPASLIELLYRITSQQVVGAKMTDEHPQMEVSSFNLPDVIYKPTFKFKKEDGDRIGVGRNSTLFAYGRSLRARGRSYSAIHAAIQNANDQRCIPPYNSRELKQLIDNIWNLPDSPKFEPKRTFGGERVDHEY
jgi:hypothetical protein